MATKTITPATASFILSEGEGSISRDTVVIVAGQDLLAGTVLGKITASGKYAAHDPSATESEFVPISCLSVPVLDFQRKGT